MILISMEALKYSVLLFLQAVDMLLNTHDSLPIIFLVTDGAVEDERHICDVMKSRLTNGGSICPRIYTFGIGNVFLLFVIC